MTEKIQSFIESEKKKLEGKSLREKLQYIWGYYSLWIIGICSAVFLTGYVIYHAGFTVKDYWFYAVFANTPEDGGNRSQLWADFVGWAGFDTRQKKVEMNSASYFDPSVPGGTNNSYYQAFVALVESGDLDVVVLGEEGLKGIGSSGRLMDLRDERCAALGEQYKDRLVYCEPYDETYEDRLVPVGIDVSDSLLVTKYHLYPDDCVLGVSAYTKRPESAEMFLRFILSEVSRESEAPQEAEVLQESEASQEAEISQESEMPKKADA